MVSTDSENGSVKAIIEGEIDLYAFLEIDVSATGDEIRRQYRRKALQYHPDKVGGDLDKFNTLSKIYEILSHEDLRRQYDALRQARANREQNKEQLKEFTRRFQDELQKAEAKVNNNELSQKRRFTNNLELLREEGIKRRRVLEAELITNRESSNTTEIRQEPVESYVSYKDLPTPSHKVELLVTKNDVYRVIVKWKFKPELRDLISEDVINQIMQTFGSIKHVQKLPYQQGSRYDQAIIEYENIDGYQSALNHNYRQSASLWDGTKVRKLASLLRECLPENSKSNVEDLIYDIKHHKNLPNDFKLPSRTHIDEVDSVLYSKILNQLG
ncbi:uncharacterized protein RJT21DRAFT_122579 [Scheffersomyces amazonensis]|uniref:uncharacterized protein n=1 Tax=Scheffersomyces amazonensis TaxID=1078765 RepID=UPI00315DAA98